MKRKQQTAREIMILFLVKLGFANLSVSNKIIKARRIISMMTGNANFTTPSPALTTLTVNADALEDAEAAMDGSKLKTDQRNTALQTLTNSLKLEQLYVETVANGNTEIILSSGFEVRKPATKPAILPAPVNVLAKSNGFEGQLQLKWKAVKGKDLYVVELSTDLNGKWQMFKQSSKASVIVEGLNPGQLYYIRVAAINTLGLSPWSDIASGRPN